VVNAHDDPTQLLKLSELAELVRTTPAYLANEIRRGRLAAYRIGREWRVSREQLEAWLNMIESRSKVA
jgi:excisionase family DNA binding protein